MFINKDLVINLNMISTVLFALVIVMVKSATYDQSQTGNLNVQVDLKDLQIIAVMKGGKEEYVDYDYAYDYSEMTIKPPSGSTSKPLNGTAVNATSTSSSLEANSSLSSSVINATHSDINLNMESTSNASIESATTESASLNITEATSVLSTSSSVKPNTTLYNGGCKKGFFLNEKGDCELKLQQNGGGNALLKLVKLSQRLKLRREKRNNTTRG